MNNPDLLFILNEIKKKDYTNRGYKGGNLFSNTALYQHGDVSPEADLAMCFLIYLRFKGFIDFSSLHDADDVNNALVITLGKKKHSNEIINLWKELSDKHDHLEELLHLLSGYDFSPFQDREHEKILARWGLPYCINEKNRFVLIDDDKDMFAIVMQCQKQLEIDFNYGDILVSTSCAGIVKSIMAEIPSASHIFFENYNDLEIGLKVNLLLLDCYSNMSLLEKKKNKKKSKKLYDGVISQNYQKDKRPKWTDLLDIVKDGGFCMSFGQNKDKLDDLFYEYEVPLMLETNELFILCKKIKNGSNVVRYGFYQIDNVVGVEMGEINNYSEFIKNNINTNLYQVLSKDDFRYTGNVEYLKVRRPEDQLSFVWESKKNFIKELPEGELLWDDELTDNVIIDRKTLSRDPFKVNVPDSFYLTKGIYESNGKKEHVAKEFQIKRINDKDYYCEVTAPKKYAPLLDHYYDDKPELNPEWKKLDKALCCRVLTRPGLLYSQGAFLRINATPENPVCYRRYDIYYDPQISMDIMCELAMDFIEIPSDFDENFIIYQLSKKIDFGETHYLVAPTKEEQHTYFLNKRLDYLAKYQPVVDEMETEVQNSIAESPACITGVGFRNFRRFIDLPAMSLAGVNILVGGNNAGKSSFVKGMLLTFDNIKNYVVDYLDNSMINVKFQYDANNYHDVHVGTFDRSYSYNAKENENISGRTMSFSLCFAHFEIRITAKPTSNNDATSVPVSEITIKDHKRKAVFTFNYEHLFTSMELVIGGVPTDFSYSGFTFKPTRQGDNLLATMIRSVVHDNDNSLTFLKNQEQVKKLRSKAGFILEIADELERMIRNTQIEYIYAHGVNQKVLFNYNDKNDYMAQTLHDLMLEKTGEVEEEFIRKWLKAFGLGTDYDIHSIGGEAYILQIKNMAGKMVYLADLGMGSNQLVILILRLATIIHRYRMLGNKPYRPTVIIEEPEQNMHPNYQTKLADLFYEVHKEYGFNFIVETHSEYMVRRSQVIVAQLKYKSLKKLIEENPFKVYYFPSEGQPYEMLYRTDGNFSNDFGKGFYDEANNLLFEII